MDMSNYHVQHIGAACDSEFGESAQSQGLTAPDVIKYHANNDQFCVQHDKDEPFYNYTQNYNDSNMDQEEQAGFQTLRCTPLTFKNVAPPQAEVEFQPLFATREVWNPLDLNQRPNLVNPVPVHYSNDKRKLCKRARKLMGERLILGTYHNSSEPSPMADTEMVLEEHHYSHGNMIKTLPLGTYGLTVENGGTGDGYHISIKSQRNLGKINVGSANREYVSRFDLEKTYWDLLGKSKFASDVPANKQMGEQGSKKEHVANIVKKIISEKEHSGSKNSTALNPSVELKYESEQEPTEPHIEQYSKMDLFNEKKSNIELADNVGASVFTCLKASQEKFMESGPSNPIDLMSNDDEYDVLSEDSDNSMDYCQSADWNTASETHLGNTDFVLLPKRDEDLQENIEHKEESTTSENIRKAFKCSII